MKRAKIIAGFPGIGKSYYKNNTGETVSDSDSSKFSWVSDGVRHPEFPQNYIDHIKELMYEVDVILVSTHQNVRDALVENDIYFTLVYPDRSLKREYIQRYKDRGNTTGFVELLEEEWDNFINGVEAQVGCTLVAMPSGKFLSDFMNNEKIRSEVVNLEYMLTHGYEEDGDQEKYLELKEELDNSYRRQFR